MVAGRRQGRRGRRAGRSSAPRPATRRRRRRPTARPPASRSSSSCRRARSRSASCSRRSSPAPASSPSTATSTRPSRIVRGLAEQDDHPVTLVNSVNPFRLDGQKTAAFEICDDLGRAPGRARHPGRQRRQHQRLLGRASASTRRPASSARRRAMWGFQAAGRRAARASATAVEQPGDRRDGDPDRRSGVVGQGHRGARRVRRPDRGRHRRRDPRRRTATSPRYEGVFCEPASAASVAGVRKVAAAGRARPGRDGRVRPDRPRAQGPDDGRAPGARPFIEAEPTRRRGRRRARLVGRNDGRALAGRARRQPGHRRGAGVVGQPRRGLRLPRRRARPHQPDRGRGPRLESRRDRADRRRRGPGRAHRGPRQPLRARARGGAAGGPRRAARGRRLADRDAQRDPAGARARLVGRGDGRRRRWRATPSLGEPLSNGRAAAPRDEIEGHPDNAAAALLGGFVVSAPSTPDGVEAIRFDAPRDLRAVLFIPELRLSTDAMRDALPDDRAAGRRRRQPRRGRARRGRPRDRPVRPARAADGRPAPRAVPGRRSTRSCRASSRPPARPARSARACRVPARPILAFADSMAGITRIEAALAAVAADTDLPGRIRVVQPRNAGARVVSGP